MYKFTGIDSEAGTVAETEILIERLQNNGEAKYSRILENRFALLDTSDLKNFIASSKWDFFTTITKNGYPDNFRLAIYELCEIMER